MPLPFIIGGLAAVAGAAGLGSGIHGGYKMKEANDTMKSAQRIQEKAVSLFEKTNNEVTSLMDEIGKQELEILSSFDTFSDLIEKIQHRPDFKVINKDGIPLFDYEPEKLQGISAGASILLGGIGGAAAGTAGGFAAAGATTSAVMALGTASTGTAISTLSGAAATNATLAALGGGSLAAHGLGITGGLAVLGGATVGVGLLIGGFIFNATGNKLSEKADEAYYQARRTEEQIHKIVDYLEQLKGASIRFKNALTSLETPYRMKLQALEYIIEFSEKTDWNKFSEKEKLTTQNLVLLVGQLYRMCKTNLVLHSDNDTINTVNETDINSAIDDAENVVAQIG